MKDESNMAQRDDLATELLTDGATDVEALPLMLEILEKQGGDLDKRVGLQSIFQNLSSIFHGNLLPKLPALILYLLPSFIYNSHSAAPTLHQTSWLDGLRGVAAFITFSHHFFRCWYPEWSKGYGSGDRDTSYLFQLPLLRIIYSGQGMVSLFFVISGYVLSTSALRKIHNGDFGKVFDALASSVFRRSCRLMLPILAATFITMLLCRANWLYTLANIKPPRRLPTFADQIGDWWWHWVRICDPFKNIDSKRGYVESYGLQLWTIPIELRGSFVVYLTLVCFAKTRTAPRIALLAGLSYYVFHMQHWDIFLFLAGLLLADMEFIRKSLIAKQNASLLENYVPHYILRNWALISQGLTILVALFAIHCLAFPDHGGSKSYGYAMFYWAPSGWPLQRFWVCVGAVLLVLAILFSPGTKHNPTPLLQRPFNTSACQYLATVSYALYVTHLHVLYTVGMWIYTQAKGKSGLDFHSVFFMAALIDTFLCLWLADVFNRAVDMNSVRLAKWIADKTFVE